MAGVDVTEDERTVEDFVAWENGDESKRRVVSESIDMYNPGLPTREAHDRQKVADYLRESRAGFPDVRFTIEEMASNDTVVLAELNVTGTHTGEFKGVPPTGREVEFGAMAKYVVENGKVEKCHIHYDTQQLADQLGLTFPEILSQLPKLAREKLNSYR